MTISEHLLAIAEELERDGTLSLLSVRVVRAVLSAELRSAEIGPPEQTKFSAAFRRAAELAEQEAHS